MAQIKSRLCLYQLKSYINISNWPLHEPFIDNIYSWSIASISASLVCCSMAFSDDGYSSIGLVFAIFPIVGVFMYMNWNVLIQSAIHFAGKCLCKYIYIYSLKRRDRNTWNFPKRHALNVTVIFQPQQL